MLTKEQIKFLKVGDPIVIHTTFRRIDTDGDLWFHAPRKEGADYYWYIDPKFVSLPGEPVEQPKHDPCRLFKKGDKVQPRSGKTVLASEYGFVTFHELAGQYEVNEDEARGTVTLIVNGHACFVSAFALELITPVEELEQYSVVDAHTHWDVADKDMKTVASYSKATHPNAKAAAKAECKRLNDEYRKEHGND